MPSRSRSRAGSLCRQLSLDRAGGLITFGSSNSRASSPTGANSSSRRKAKLDSYMAKTLRRSASTSSMQTLDGGASIKAPSIAAAMGGVAKVGIRRWDGNQRTTTRWDYVRRDPELWFPNGDCLVYFYARGTSRRGASLRVSLADLHASDCAPLLEQCYSDPATAPAADLAGSESDRSSRGSDDLRDMANTARHELYISAPAHLSRDEALQYHLTTRNFFAWLYDRPVVGEALGQSLIALRERLGRYRPSEEHNEDDMLKFIDDQAYTDFRNCPDHALAVLQYAEHCRHLDLWRDAFVHCTGMYDRLETSGEFESTSRASSALITRAHIEMDIRLDRAGAGLANFLDDELSGSSLGLGKDAQVHLERFRSFLHGFYVGQYGYWPPTSLDATSDSFPTAIYQAMYFDFRHLYEYLADRQSSDSGDCKSLDGGLCINKNIEAFDKKNRYVPLPHPLPLVPKVPAYINQSKGLKRFFGGHKQDKLNRRIGASAALTAATNSHQMQVMRNTLVLQYLEFEKIWTMKEEVNVSCADARKVRWILIYALLQTLIPVTRTPVEVRDVEGVEYPLCVLLAGTPSWTTEDQEAVVIEPTKAMATSQIDSVAQVAAVPAQPPATPAQAQHNHLIRTRHMPVASARPSPLAILRTSDMPALPQQEASISGNLSLRAPQPVSAAVQDFLEQHQRQTPGIITPVDSDRSHAASTSQTPLPPFQTEPVFATPSETPVFSPVMYSSAQSSQHQLPAYPATPDHAAYTASSRTNQSSIHGGWSSTASSNGFDINDGDINYDDDDGMAHHSVMGSSSRSGSYNGDVNDEADKNNTLRTSKQASSFPRLRKTKSSRSLADHRIVKPKAPPGQNTQSCPVTIAPTPCPVSSRCRKMVPASAVAPAFTPRTRPAMPERSQTATHPPKSRITTATNSKSAPVSSYPSRRTSRLIVNYVDDDDDDETEKESGPTSFYPSRSMSRVDEQRITYSSTFERDQAYASSTLAMGSSAALKGLNDELEQFLLGY